MQITKVVTVKLTPQDVESIIVGYLRSEGIQVSSTHFKISGYNQADDFHAEQPLDYRLDEVICEGLELPQNPEE